MFLTRNINIGWGSRIQTYGTRDQNPMPYHLATPQFNNELHYLKFNIKHFRRTNSIDIVITFFTIPYKVILLKILIDFEMSFQILNIPKHVEPLPLIPYATISGILFNFSKISEICGVNLIADSNSEL